ncbi:hypothetical protein ADJ79_08230 [Ottowia sp. oral taxon 894]|nr:hypothetical protein ADJ79_08230 [Ottowia sp. oral taxon 894]
MLLLLWVFVAYLAAEGMVTMLIFFPLEEMLHAPMLAYQANPWFWLMIRGQLKRPQIARVGACVRAHKWLSRPALIVFPRGRLELRFSPWEG